MNTTAQPATKPTATSSPVSATSEDQNFRQAYYGAVLNMSWQLAVVVLVPVLGGHWLDGHYHTAPLWLLVGFGIAIAGMVLTVWRQYRNLSPASPVKEAPKS